MVGAAFDMPVPGTSTSTVVVPAPCPGEGNWAGAPSAALDEEGAVVLAYRIRLARGRGVANVVARAFEGDSFTTVATIERERFGAFSLERPAIVRTAVGKWRLYVSCDEGDKAWRIDMLEAGTLAGLGAASPRTVMGADALTAVKDPVIRRRGEHWHAWVCCHPLDEPGEEDRMRTGYFTSKDGYGWDYARPALEGRSGHWDARGARVTAVLSNGWATYDGRATKEDNFLERTGIARPGRRAGELVACDPGPVSSARYLEILELADGRFLLFYELPLADGSHELRSESSGPLGAAAARAESSPDRS